MSYKGFTSKTWHLVGMLSTWSLTKVSRIYSSKSSTLYLVEFVIFLKSNRIPIHIYIYIYIYITFLRPYCVAKRGVYVSSFSWLSASATSLKSTCILYGLHFMLYNHFGTDV